MITAKEARDITDICSSVEKYKKIIVENAASGLDYCIISNPTDKEIMALMLNGYTVRNTDKFLSDFMVSW